MYFLPISPPLSSIRGMSLVECHLRTRCIQTLASSTPSPRKKAISTILSLHSSSRKAFVFSSSRISREADEKGKNSIPSRGAASSPLGNSILEMRLRFGDPEEAVYDALRRGKAPRLPCGSDGGRSSSVPSRQKAGGNEFSRLRERRREKQKGGKGKRLGQRGETTRYVPRYCGRKPAELSVPCKSCFPRWFTGPMPRRG